MCEHHPGEANERALQQACQPASSCAAIQCDATHEPPPPASARKLCIELAHNNITTPRDCLASSDLLAAIFNHACCILPFRPCSRMLFNFHIFLDL